MAYVKHFSFVGLFQLSSYRSRASRVPFLKMHIKHTLDINNNNNININGVIDRVIVPKNGRIKTNKMFHQKLCIKQQHNNQLTVMLFLLSLHTAQIYQHTFVSDKSDQTGFLIPFPLDPE